MKLKKVKRVSKVESEFATKFDADGRRLMVCMNSSKESKYYQDRDCYRYTSVGEEIAAVLCFQCTIALTDPPAIKVAPVKSDKPKGWKFMAVYVHTDGTVYHKGVEQSELKGTMPVTIIQPKPEKKKLTKQEKEAEVQALGKEIESLKIKLFHETKKGKKTEMLRALTKANRQLKKLV